MSTPGSRTMAIGLTGMMLSISAAMHYSGAGGSGFVLCFMGVLVSANLVAVGIRMVDVPAPTFLFPSALGSARALTAFVRRNTSTVGLLMSSCAFTAVSGEADPVLFLGMYVLLLLGLALINAGIRRQRSMKP